MHLQRIGSYCFHRHPSAAYLGLLAFLTLLYFAVGKLGLTLAFVHANATAVWPPTGLALAACLLLGFRVWPAVLLGAFLVNVTTVISFMTALGIAIGNTLEALAGAYLVNRFANGSKALMRPMDVFTFAVLAGGVSTLISATFGTTALALNGFAQWADYDSIWLTWWLGDMGGALVVAPFLMLWGADHRRPWTFRQVCELICLLLVVVLFGLLVFGGWLPGETKTYPLEFLCVPPLIWVAFRFSPRETATAILLLSMIATWGTVRGLGPFGWVTQNESLLLLQAFMTVVNVMALALAAAFLDRKQAGAALQRAHSELEHRVKERTLELAKANEELLVEIDERGQIEQALRDSELRLQQTNELLVRNQTDLLTTLAKLKRSHDELKTAHLHLIQAAKLESVGRLAAGVAHEVKNPLAIILQGVDYLSKRVATNKNDDTARVLEYTADAVRRADGVIRGLLDFSTTRELILQTEDLNAIIEQALLLVQHEVNRTHVTAVKDLGALPRVRIDRNKIEQVFVNVMMNAIQAMTKGGTLTVRTFTRRMTEIGPEVGMRKRDQFRLGETVVVSEVEDTGSGIPEQILQKVFDPFFTTKPTGTGTGLGLTVTKKILELHGGLISVKNRREGGAKVTVILKAEGANVNGQKAHSPH